MSFVGIGEEHKKAVKQALEHCEANIGSLTDWEQTFIESISEQFTMRGRLSEKQEEILERIYCDLP